MRRIVLVDDDSCLKNFLNNFSAEGKTRWGYIVFESADFGNLNILEEKGFKNIIPDDCRAGFIKEYIDLIGRIGRSHDTREWFAADISSKNRFTSRLS